MREIAELSGDQDLLNETETIANVCKELLMFRRPFYELSSSGKVIERFLEEFNTSKSIEVPKVSGKRYLTPLERKKEFEDDTIKSEVEVRL